MKHDRFYLRDDKTAYFDTYLLSNKLNEKTEVKRPALIICPGGFYLFKSYREGEPVAAQFSAMGYQTFVLSYSTYFKKKYYSLEDVELNPLCPYPEPLFDLFNTIKMVREHADEWGIYKDQVYVMGFSAGGHLAASSAVYYNNPDFLKHLGIKDPNIIRPDAAVLSYPMIDAEIIRDRVKYKDKIKFEREEDEVTAQYLLKGVFGTDEPTEEMWDAMMLRDKITEDSPPFFIWHTFEDVVTSPLDTTKFVEKLIEKKVNCEYHLFNSGHHGMSLATPSVATAEGDYIYNNAIWPVLADLFLKRLGEKSK